MSTQILFVGAGCRRRGASYYPGHQAPTVAPAPDGGAEYVPVFVPDSFDALYPVFLLRKVDPVQKAQIWTRYEGRWVRWTGELVSFTRDGFCVRQIARTTTFDVSVSIDVESRARIQREYKRGDRIVYVGRLNNYEDLFRTFYLAQGGIIGLAPPASPTPTSPPPEPSPTTPPATPAPNRR